MWLPTIRKNTNNDNYHAQYYVILHNEYEYDNNHNQQCLRQPPKQVTNSDMRCEPIILPVIESPQFVTENSETNNLQ